MTSDRHFEKRLELGNELAELLDGALLAANPTQSFQDLYIRSLALQFVSNLRAVLLLLSHGMDSEAWAVSRSMSELLIKLKWVKKRKYRARWMILGKEQQDLKQFSKIPLRSRILKDSIKALTARLAAFGTISPKSRIWMKNNPGFVRDLPSIKKMAEDVGMRGLYRGAFKWGCEHVHASHRVLDRFMVLGPNRTFTGTFVLSPYRELPFASHNILNFVFIFIHLVRLFGLPVDKARYVAIANRFRKMRPAQRLGDREPR